MSFTGASAPVEVNEQDKRVAPLAGVPGEIVAPLFVAGDRVRVMLDLEIFKMMQEGHGGWSDKMAEVSAYGITEYVK